MEKTLVCHSSTYASLLRMYLLQCSHVLSLAIVEMYDMTYMCNDSLIEHKLK